MMSKFTISDRIASSVRRHALHRLVPPTIVLAALIGCDNTTGPWRRNEVALRLTTDSAYTHGSCTAGSYCLSAVPSSGTMTAMLAFGPPTDDPSEPVCCLGTIVSTFNDVHFANSLLGTSVVDTDSIMTVSVSPDPHHGFDYYPYFTLTGKMTNGRYTGRWYQRVHGHGVGFVGSFVTVP